MFDFDVVTGPSPAERAALERARSSNTPAALAETARQTAPQARLGGIAPTSPPAKPE